MTAKTDLSAVRTILIDEQRWYSLLDTIKQIGADPASEDVYNTYTALPEEHRRIHVLYADDGVPEHGPVVTGHGLTQFLLTSSQPSVRAYVASTVLSTVERQVGITVQSGASTRWGEQPFRDRVRRHNLSMSEFAKLLNKHVRTGERKLTMAGVVAVSQGRQLPNPVLARAMVWVLQAPLSELLTLEAAEAFTRKYGQEPASPAPAPDITPAPDPVDDEPFDMAAEEAKMDAAFADILGPAAFQSGFSAVTGADTPSEPSPHAAPPASDD